MRSAMEREFARRLEIMAGTAASQIGAQDVADAERMGEEGTGYIAIQVILEQLRSVPGVFRASLLDTAGAVIYDTQGPELTQTPSRLRARVPETLARAYAGDAAVSPLYRAEGGLGRAGVAPIRDRGRVAAVLAVEARPSYAEDLARLRRSLLLSAAVIGLALAILAWGIFRLAWSAVLLERRLSRAENLAAMGRLTATLAHEIKNPLAIIRGSAQRLAKLDPEARRMAESVVEEADRLSRTVGRYLEFARPAGAGSGNGDAIAALEATLGLLHDDFAQRGIVVEKSLGSGPAAVALDGESLRQVYLNLLLNAAEAMPEGGVVRLAVATSGRGVEVEIADSGAGVPPEVLTEIGQPFFTTKAQGSGLGLFLSRRLVQGAGGDLEIRSDARGTRCTVRLPRAKESGRPQA